MTVRMAGIALFLPSAGGGGAERNTLRLAQHLVQRGAPVDVVLARARGPFLPEVPSACRVVDLGASRVTLAVPALARYLRAARPRVLIAALDHANVAALLAAGLAGTGVPVVASVRNTMTLQLARSRSWRERVVLPRMMRLTYPRAAAVVAVSAGAAHDLAALLQGRVRVEVIGNPVVTDELQRQAQAPCDDPWFAPGAPPVVAGIGRLTEQKGFDVLLDAFAQVRASRPARLWIAGQGELAGALAARAASLGVAGDVRLAGFVANPFPQLRRSRVFALSSRFEGLPTALLEALALGTRVVSTDCPSGPAELLDGGRWGRLVPVGDGAALAAALHAALDADAWPHPPAEVLAPYTPAGVLAAWDALLSRLGVAVA